MPDIRNANISDAPTISQLIFRVAHLYNKNDSSGLPPWFLEAITPSAIQANMGDPAFHYLVSEDAEKLTGIIALRNASHIYHLFVDPAYHRQGIATALWTRAKEAALAMGNKKEFAVRSSEYAVPVYQRFGFRATGRREEKNGIIFVPMRLMLS